MNEKLDLVLAEVQALRKDVADYAQQTATNTAHIGWLKGIVGTLGTAFLGAFAYLLKRVVG